MFLYSLPPSYHWVGTWDVFVVGCHVWFGLSITRAARPDRAMGLGLVSGLGRVCDRWRFVTFWALQDWWQSLNILPFSAFRFLAWFSPVKISASDQFNRHKSILFSSFSSLSLLGFVLFSKSILLLVTVLGCCVNLGELSDQIDYHRCRAVIAFKSVISYHGTTLKSLFLCHCILSVFNNSRYSWSDYIQN